MVENKITSKQHILTKVLGFQLRQAHATRV